MATDLQRSDVTGQASPTESIISALWKEVLQVPGLPSATDNFFQLGGDSIGMVTVLFRIQEEFSVELPPEAMFDAPTILELAALVDAASSPKPLSIS